MSNNLLKINNNKIVVLGGSGLIGTEVVKQLSKLNSKIYIIDSKKPKIKLNKNLKYIQIDICNQEIESIITDLVDKKYHYLVNCTYPKSLDWINNNIKDVQKSSFNDNILKNINSYIWITKIFCDRLLKYKRPGSIVLLNSIYGILGQNLNLYENTNMKENLSYSIYKGGITNGIRQLSSYYSKYNIRINGVCAGGVLGHVAGKRGVQEKNFIKNYKRFCPIGRLAKPNEIANSVIFLLSNMSSYITGSNLNVDGGYSSI